MKQVLVNLIGNALKFTPEGSVRLEINFSEEAPAKLRFRVVDTGIGISEEDLKKLFKSFSQAETSVSRSFGGTGLGLAISKRLVGMLGGDIAVESELNVGSTFSFEIDTGNLEGVRLVEPNLDEIVKLQLDETEEISLSCHVLVVDDRRDVRYLTKKFLSDAGAQVTLAASGSKAVKLIERSLAGKAPGFDVVVLDMQMPGIDGYEAASRLRAMNFKQPIIALTADAMQADISKSLHSGCDAFLSKPIDREKLLRLVREYAEPQRSDQTVSSAVPQVLLVDDSKDACLSTKRLLELEASVDIRAVHSGKAAIDEVDGWVPDIVLLDLGLPDLDGYKVLTELQKLPELAKTRFFAVSGRSEPEEIKKSLELGFESHIVKPPDIDFLLKLFK